jgi:signal transduction histidine kinase
VQDNGIGIDPAYFGVIFEMFERLDRKEGSDSTGVGLAICRRIIERHGGRLWVESARAGGSTFHFTLPAAGGNTHG